MSPDVVWDLDKERGLETNPKPVQCSASYACHADSHTSFCLIHYNCIFIYTCDCILSVFVFVLSLHVMQTAASFLSIHCHCICICNCNCICIYICNCICIFYLYLYCLCMSCGQPAAFAPFIVVTGIGRMRAKHQQHGYRMVQGG